MRRVESLLTPGLRKIGTAVSGSDDLVRQPNPRRTRPGGRSRRRRPAAWQVLLELGVVADRIYRPDGQMFFDILATFTEFEVGLLRMRAREGMATCGQSVVHSCDLTDA